ncbi:hypothetical protein LTR85_006795 [Meristemomyces frigidus]|nr:hypothetical protein LTR85_006795 [Meristemomyces frigidus]
MAVHDELPGVQITIIADGQPLHEYQDTDIDEDDKTVTRYIKADSDQEFKIKVELGKNTVFKGDCLSFQVFVDGTQVDDLLPSKSQALEGGLTQYSEGVDLPNNQIRKYRFASVETANDGHKLDYEADRVKDLGEIMVHVHHQRLIGCQAVERTGSYDTSGAQLGFVSEKALKGRTVSHSVEFGEAVEKEEEDEYYDADFVDDEDDPAGIFVFNYRSIQALRSMLIIPRTPTPPPLEERDITTPTPDELRELQRARAARDEKQAKIKIKRERADENARPRKVARPNANSTQLEFDDDGGVRASSTPTIAEQVVIVLD